MLRHLMTVQVIFRGRSITYSTNYGVCVYKKPWRRKWVHTPAPI